MAAAEEILTRTLEDASDTIDELLVVQECLTGYQK